MSDLNVKLTLTEDLSKKFNKISSSGKSAEKALKSMGQAIDNVFGDIEKSADSATTEASQLGEAIQDIDFDGTDVSDWIDDLSKQIKEVTSELNKLSKEMDDLDNGVDLGGSSSDLGNIADKADEAGDSLRQMDSQAGSLTGTIKGLVAAVASYVALDTIKDFGLDTLETAANQQAMTSQFGQVFGDLEGTASSSLGQIADDTGILENRLKSSYTQIAAFAKTTGMETADALELSNRAMIAVADSAAFYDRSLEEVTESLQSYLKGNYENDAALGLSSTEYTRNAAAMELYNKEFQDLTESQKQLTLLQMVEDANELSGAMGQAARESETWSNQTGNLAQAWTDLKAELGDEILDESVEGIGVLIDNMDTIKEPLVDLFSTVGDVMQDIIPMIPGVLKTLTNGLKALGNVLGPLFEGVRKNPDLVGNAIASIGSAALTYKAATNLPNVVSGISNLWGVLSNHPWAIGATAVVGAIGAIGTAMEYINGIQIKNSLDEHFGDVSLDTAQIESMASRILNASWTVNVSTALGHIENADELADQAEAALKENDALEWQARVGTTLTEDDQTAYLQNINTFATNVENSLKERTISANMIAEEFSLTGPDGEKLSDLIEDWAAEDMAQMDLDTQALTRLVENALLDGVIDVDEQAAIDQMQNKINNILTGWKEAQAEAEMDLLTQKYGRLSGADLEDDTFLSLIDELGEQRETAQEALDEASKAMYSTINSLNNPDEEGNQRISDYEAEHYKEQVAYASQNEEAAMLANSLQFETNTLEDAYGAKLDENYAAMQEMTSDSLSNARHYLETLDYVSLTDELYNGYLSAMETTGFFSDKDQKALTKIYESMQPDVENMQETIDEYRRLGLAIPEDVMTAFNEAVELGAAAGDADAAWQVFANQLISEPENQAIMDAIDQGLIEVPSELRSAIERALAETTSDPVTIEGLQGELEDPKINTKNVEDLIAQAYEGLEATGGYTVLDGGEIALEYEVTTGDTLSGIAEETGVALEELKAANQHILDENGSWDMIYEGNLIYIPQVEIDSSSIAAELGKEADEELKESVGEDPVETEKPVDITYTEGEKDTSQLDDSLPETLPGEEAVNREIPTAITFEVASLDDSALASGVEGLLGEQEPIALDVPVAINAIQESFSADEALASAAESLTAAFVTPLPADGYADVLINKTSDNIASLYSQIGAELQSAFDSTYSVTAKAMIHVNYSLANPTASLSFSGGGTGQTTVSAALHAAGGYFDEPHLGMVAEAGPEYIIPIDGSDRSRDMLYDAGEMLGMDMRDDSVAAPQVWGGESGEYTETRNDSRTITININGNGSIQTNGEVSKEAMLQVLMDNVKGVLMNILTDDILVEGDGSYEY